MAKGTSSGSGGGSGSSGGGGKGDDRGGSSSGRVPNDDRSDVKNPNNPDYEADRANRENLGHGNT